MSDILPTVRVKSLASGYMIINESDFDPAVHELFDAPAAAVIVIPADWEALHHNAKIKLAETILGVDDLVPVGDDTKTETAIKAIAAEVAKRG